MSTKIRTAGLEATIAGLRAQLAFLKKQSDEYFAAERQANAYIIRIANALKCADGEDLPEIRAKELLAERDSLRTELETLREERDNARKFRDIAEANARWIEGVKACRSAVELSGKLPPDILMTPLPLPDRLDYAAKMIQAAFESWVSNEGWLESMAALRAENARLMEENARQSKLLAEAHSTLFSEDRPLAEEAIAKMNAQLTARIAELQAVGVDVLNHYLRLVNWSDDNE